VCADLRLPVSRNWYFTPPFHEFTVEQGDHLLALVIFLLVGRGR